MHGLLAAYPAVTQSLKEYLAIIVNKHSGLLDRHGNALYRSAPKYTRVFGARAGTPDMPGALP